MSATEKSRATFQIHRVRSMEAFLKEPHIQKAVAAACPVTMPSDPGTLGFDIRFWSGMGVVGLWSALDAYADRVGLKKMGGAKCKKCGKSCLVARLNQAARLPSALQDALEEIEDIRHLFAHNFAGEADSFYLGNRPRHVLQGAATKPLSCGACWDGRGVPLEFSQVTFYADKAEAILRCLP